MSEPDVPVSTHREELQVRRMMMMKQILFVMLCIGTLSSDFAAQNAPAEPIKPETSKRYIFASPQSKKTVVNSQIAGSKTNGEKNETKSVTIKPAKNSKTNAVAKNDEISSDVYVVDGDLTSGDNGGANVVTNDSVDKNAVIQNVSASDSNKSVAPMIEKTNNIATVSTVAIKTKTNKPTEIYQIGVTDVLDIKLFNANGLISSRGDSTLFTVMDGGIIDFPLAGESLKVAGMTSEETAELLRNKIKLYDDITVQVGIREFASHRVTINGLVERAGTKFLQRESIPLFALLAEAVQLPMANRVIIKRKNQSDVVIDLNKLSPDALVQSGDDIQVIASDKENAGYYYIAGAVMNAGQKDFHAGMTLMQAILAAGGASRTTNLKIIISRQNQSGLLVSKEFNLKQIKNGKVPDPLLEVGDRIEIGN